MEYVFADVRVVSQGRLHQHSLYFVQRVYLYFLYHYHNKNYYPKPYCKIRL